MLNIKYSDSIIYKLGNSEHTPLHATVYSKDKNPIFKIAFRVSDFKFGATEKVASAFQSCDVNELVKHLQDYCGEPIWLKSKSLSLDIKPTLIKIDKNNTCWFHRENAFDSETFSLRTGFSNSGGDEAIFCQNGKLLGKSQYHNEIWDCNFVCPKTKELTLLILKSGKLQYIADVLEEKSGVIKIMPSLKNKFIVETTFRGVFGYYKLVD